MAATKGPEGDYMAVAAYCLRQARKVIETVEEFSPDDRDSQSDLDDGDGELYILRLQRVYKSCCILNRYWPSVFPRSARNIANTFIQRWKASDGESLRDTYAHYEEALADPCHRLRGEPLVYGVVRGMDVPAWKYGYSGQVKLGDAARGPDEWQLLGKEYRLEGVYEALVELEREFLAVLVDPETGNLRSDA